MSPHLFDLSRSGMSAIHLVYTVVPGMTMSGGISRELLLSSVMASKLSREEAVSGVGLELCCRLIDR